ncbi:hypothetical protein CBM2609_B70341 [Cupriavidus taiwanensis]|nr:hypothetical protein CBM2604_B60338 [Cupriavidus taiwanensis]SOZ33405.1 hypothetical protein CBM2609_B70341 [Cupriavidus taiwanensis]SOZ48717.1 hypothetical protein CBM2610_B50340 [Cupriavidus taiwanensis]SPA01355.1 hypothetical protein CBM2626_B110297 [Cupriavidus taiwanensis]
MKHSRFGAVPQPRNPWMGRHITYRAVRIRLCSFQLPTICYPHNHVLTLSLAKIFWIATANQIPGSFGQTSPAGKLQRSHETRPMICM